MRKKNFWFLVIIFLIMFSGVVGSGEVSDIKVKEAKIVDKEEVRIRTIPQEINISEQPPGFIVSGYKKEIRNMVNQHGGILKQEYHIIDAFYVDNLPPAAIKSLKARGFKVEPNKYYYLHDIEADQLIEADLVWDLGYNGSGIKVAVIDTGVQQDHLDLSPHIVACYNNGCVDKDGHGTHVAGIITASDGGTTLSYNATGVAPGALIYSARACGKSGCPTDWILNAIDWSVSQNVDVISMSIGGGNYYEENCDSIGDSIVDAVNNVNYNYDIPFVISAGNENDGVSFPACASGAIAVGATYHKNYIGTVNWRDCVDTDPITDQKVCWSNYGLALDIMAPGVDIFSTYSCDAAQPPKPCDYVWYATMSGTSMSAPHISGVIALMKEKNPSLSVNEIKSILYNTSLDLGDSGWDQYYGWGRVNALAAVNAVAPPGEFISITLTSGTPITFGNMDSGTTQNATNNPLIVNVDSNINFDITTKADNEDFVSGSNTFPVSNMEWDTDSVFPGTDYTISEATLYSNEESGDFNIYHQLTMPTGQKAGSYSVGITITAKEYV